MRNVRQLLVSDRADPTMLDELRLQAHDPETGRADQDCQLPLISNGCRATNESTWSTLAAHQLVAPSAPARKVTSGTTSTSALSGGSPEPRVECCKSERQAAVRESPLAGPRVATTNNGSSWLPAAHHSCRNSSKVRRSGRKRAIGAVPRSGSNNSCNHPFALPSGYRASAAPRLLARMSRYWAAPARAIHG